MKKLFIISICCVAIHFNSSAQSARFGITAGVDFANYNVSGGDQTSSFSSKTGITAGVLVDLPISKNFSFQPGANFVQKGMQDQAVVDGITFKEQLNVNNLEMPLNFMFNSRGSGSNFFIGAGPSFAYALSGTSKVEDGTNSISEKLKFGSTQDDDMKSIDVGANFTTGFQFNNGLMFSVNYNTGLNNLIPTDSGPGTMKSYYFGIKLGFLLPGGGKK